MFLKRLTMENYMLYLSSNHPNKELKKGEKKYG